MAGCNFFPYGLLGVGWAWWYFSEEFAEIRKKFNDAEKKMDKIRDEVHATKFEVDSLRIDVKYKVWPNATLLQGSLGEVKDELRKQRLQNIETAGWIKRLNPVLEEATKGGKEVQRCDLNEAEKKRFAAVIVALGAAACKACINTDEEGGGASGRMFSDKMVACMTKKVVEDLAEEGIKNK